MNRCSAHQERTSTQTQCWLNTGHEGNHRRYGDPQNDAIEWPNTDTINLTDIPATIQRIKERLGL